MSETDTSSSSGQLYWGGRFRELYEAIREHEGGELAQDVLRPWLLVNQVAAAKWLAAFARREGEPIPPATVHELWSLYALSRISDVLLGSFQPSTLNAERQSNGIPWRSYLQFMTGLGFEVAAPTAFSPFYHEIVEVVQEEEDDEPPQLTQTFWPCMMLGNMLFSRAGVGVRAGRSHLRAEVAASSTLYWAFTRRYRPCEDLSHGWGYNSQWSTRFRRDYRLGRKMFFNVDAEHNIDHDEPPDMGGVPLTPAERRELVEHRCLVTFQGAHEDRCPYNFRLRREEAES